MERLYKFVSQLDTPHADIFTIIKPGFLHLSDDIVKEFEENGWEVYKTRTKQLLSSEARELYKIHKKEDWYEPLVKYMSSGPTLAIIFRKVGNIPDDIYKAVGEIKDKIRDEYGESDMRNVMHSSDSLEHMMQEMQVYF